jgi:hypothetical protein
VILSIRDGRRRVNIINSTNTFTNSASISAGDSSSAKIKGSDEQLVEFSQAVEVKADALALLNSPEPDAKFSQDELIIIVEGRTAVKQRGGSNPGGIAATATCREKSDPVNSEYLEPRMHRHRYRH